MNTLESNQSISLLEELCGYQPELSDDAANGLPTHQTVPPTGLSDTGLADVIG